MGNLPSCVECVEDDTFPRPLNADNNGSMCDSVNMTQLPGANSSHGGTSSGMIPFTKETTEDIVHVSAMKPLGVTLCDSDSTKGVFLTAIKPEGNVAKLSQPISVGMLLLELNGVNVASETLDNVIHMISSSPPEKRLIMKFCGTKPPAEVASTAITTPNNTAAATTSTNVSETKEVESSKKEEESTSIVKKNTGEEAHSEEKDKAQEEKKEEERVKVKDQPNAGDEVETEEDKKEEMKEEEMKEAETSEKVSTPVKNGSSSSNSIQSMDTVDINTPNPTTAISSVTSVADPSCEDSLSQEDLEKEFSNVSLGSNEEEDDHSRVSSFEDTTDSKDEDKKGGVEEEEVLLRCSQCDIDLPKDSFSATQLKKKVKRKCKGCK